MLNIGVLISGSGTNLQAIIDETKAGGINGTIKVVISSKKNASEMMLTDNWDNLNLLDTEIPRKSSQQEVKLSQRGKMDWISFI